MANNLDDIMWIKTLLKHYTLEDSYLHCNYCGKIYHEKSLLKIIKEHLLDEHINDINWDMENEGSNSHDEGSDSISSNHAETDSLYNENSNRISLYKENIKKFIKYTDDECTEAISLQEMGSERELISSIDNSTQTDEVESSALQLVCPLDSRPVQLIFRGLQVVKEKRALLRDVSGVVKPGELLAVMGPSGCGKTTLLNCLSGRVGVDGGEIWLNRERLTKRWRRRICYVQQQDIFFPDLTLRQTLEYQARLRLPDTLSHSQKMQCVDHIIEVLDLAACQDTIIGDYSKRGISGGEKKRTSIACELLTNPSLMLLDEPTSGLDSHSAQALISRLKKYAEQEGKSIVVTVHQPSSRMFHSFSKLLLLSNGQVAYYGSTANVGRFFSTIGLTLLPHYNPADFILEQIKGPEEVRDRIVAAARAARQGPDCPPELRPEYNPSQHPLCDHLIHYHEHHISHNVKEDEGRTLWLDTQSHASSSASSADDDYSWQWPTSFWSQFKVLSERNFQEARPRMLSRLHWLQTVALGLLTGLLWLGLPRTEAAIHDIQGWMFFSNTYWMLFAHFGALTSFPPEREVINKERLSGSYRLSAYYLAKMVGELPLTITLPAVYHMISYPMLGFHNLAVFITLLMFLLLNTVVAQSVGFFVGACCEDLQVGITVSALYTLSTQLLGGYLATSVPPWLAWARYISMMHYAYQNMQILEFGVGEPIACSQPTKFAECRNGTTIPVSAILESQGGVRGSGLPLWANTAVLLAFLIVFRTLGYLVLRYYRVPK